MNSQSPSMSGGVLSDPFVLRNQSVVVMMICALVALGAVGVSVFFANKASEASARQWVILESPGDALSRKTLPYRPMSVEGVKLFISQAMPMLLNFTHDHEAQSQQFRLARQVLAGSLLDGDGGLNPGLAAEYLKNQSYIASRQISQKWNTLNVDIDASAWPISAIVTGFVETSFLNTTTGARDVRNQMSTYYIEVSKTADLENYPFGLVISAGGVADAEQKQAELDRIRNLLEGPMSDEAKKASALERERVKRTRQDMDAQGR